MLSLWWGGEMVFSEAVMQTEPKTKVAGVDEANEMESKEAEKIGASKCEGLYYLGGDLDIQQGTGRSNIPSLFYF